MNKHDLSLVVGKVAIVTHPFVNPEEEYRQSRPLRLAAVLAPLATEVFIVTGNFHHAIPYQNVKVVNVKTPIVRRQKESLLLRVRRFICAQFTLSLALIRLTIQAEDKVDVIFFFGAETLVVPAITCKLLRKYVGLVLRGSLETETRMAGDHFSKFLSCLKRISMALSDNIFLYSKSLITQWDLKRYEDKIVVAPSDVWVDTNRFKATEPLFTREKVIGCVGRIDVVSGVYNLVQAMTEVLKEMRDVRALIVGDGQSRAEVGRFLQSECWVTHDDLPLYLNQLKLMVLPSYSEGLPTRALEAMACGTPVLATSVGSIPDIIRDGETGFIMADNSPECIASNVLRALNHPNLDQISENGIALIEREYRYEVIRDRFRTVIAELHRGREW